MRIAIIGTGIAGLSCAWLLNRRRQITVYEADGRIGGHSHTVTVPWRDTEVPVDTGFMVYNEHNYPNLTQLFAGLGVRTKPSHMSFAVSVDRGALEYAGTSIRTLFAQTSNAWRPAFHRMWQDILRFNRDARRFLSDAAAGDSSLGEFLTARRYGNHFRDHYLLPMGAAIWSAPTEAIAHFPARSFLQFFANHGLLTINHRPLWRTVEGGASAYVDRLSAPFADRIKLATAVTGIRRIAGGVEVRDAKGGRTFFDQAVLACHADQALAMIERPTVAEQSILGAFHYQRNRGVLHRDPALMPRRRGVWSSWNYLSSCERGSGAEVSVTYWMNHLQRIDPACPLFVSLNPLRAPDPAKTIAEFDYDHPQYTASTLAAQTRLAEIQGQDGLWFCGAHWGYGFHEDGLRSGLTVAQALGAAPPWWPTAPVTQIKDARRRRTTRLVASA